MSPGFQLILGCLLLSFATTYAWWVKFRVLLLRIDLARLANDFRRDFAGHDAGNAEKNIDFLESIDSLIEVAPLLYPSLIGPMARLSQGNLAGLLGPGAEPFLQLYLREDLEPTPPELRAAIWKVSFRLARYLAFETLTGWFLILRTVVLGLEELPIDAENPGVETRNSMEIRAFAALFSRGRFRRVA